MLTNDELEMCHTARRLAKAYRESIIPNQPEAGLLDGLVDTVYRLYTEILEMECCGNCKHFLFLYDDTVGWDCDKGSLGENGEPLVYGCDDWEGRDGRQED